MALTTLAVCIATYRRPTGLRSLLVALGKQLPTPGCSWRVVVIDNDPAGGAAAIVNECRANLACPIDFDIEPQRGISHARNRSVRRAGMVDWIVFVDDDEVPPPGWLRSLLEVQRRFGADIVNGPVVGQFEPGGPAWVRGLPHFHSPSLPTGTRIETATTANTLVARPLLGDAPFDIDYFNMFGQDTDAFLRLARAGATIVWSDEEPVAATVPPGRQSLRYAVHRSAVDARNWARIDRRYRPGLKTTASLVARGLGHSVLGTAGAAVALLFLRRGEAARGACRVAKGAGLLAGACARRLPPR